MKNRNEDSVEQALQRLAEERERDLTELARKGQPTHSPDLKAAFLRQMEEERKELPEAPETHVIPAEEPRVWRGWHLVPSGLLAAALLLLVGGIGWFKSSRGPQGEEPGSHDSRNAGSMEPGPTLGAAAYSAKGDKAIQFKSWEGNLLTLEFARDDYDSDLYSLRVTIRYGLDWVVGPEELISSVQSFELPDGFLHEGGAVDVAVQILGDGVEVGRWKAKIQRQPSGDVGMPGQ